jgi:hypothetical protein
MISAFGQFVNGFLASTASNVWTKPFVDWIHKVSGHQAVQNKPPTQDELLAMIEHNTAQVRDAQLHQAKHRVVMYVNLQKNPFLLRVDNFDRNKVWIISDAPFTLQYDTGGTQAITAGIRNEIFPFARIGLTDADVNPMRLVRMEMSDT